MRTMPLDGSELASTASRMVLGPELTTAAPPAFPALESAGMGGLAGAAQLVARSEPAQSSRASGRGRCMTPPVVFDLSGGCVIACASLKEECMRRFAVVPRR